MKHIKIFEEFREKVVTFTNKRNPRLVIKVTKTPDGRITDIDNPNGIRFCFSVGQLFNRTAEIWASNNNYLMDGQDMTPEEKIMGIKVSDIPPGHELRRLYPHKFRK